ncbi:hypothetical protein PHYBOEH_010615 [Phytophthora boehmeriae]|uniref:TOG domain-containing protein n=1 Tax=Phytophthora boehmeriae TaxID=109152 RepID=A0A8T1VMI8_9STRA|nr:hypothetical protein PHYBOEH_010615 [Phytophthora boehmeriae]
METNVDTLVYQLEDDDITVRLATLQKLRRIAAVETSHFPVRNTRRFLQCVRRRIVGDTDRRVAIEALRLISDVMVSLGDNVDQILSSILPHLIPCLKNRGQLEDEEEDDGVDESDALHDEMISTFRKYASIANDLQSVADLLVNVGLGSVHAAVREISLVVLMQLLDDRFQKHALTPRGNSPKLPRTDKALMVSLVQAIIPALEDLNETVVVAAEEAIAKLELYWGDRFSVEIMQFLSSEDKRTLHDHQEPISDFLQACTTASSPQQSPQSGAIPSGESREQFPSNGPATTSRPSPSKVHPLGSTNHLRFGFLDADIVTTLTTNTSNSNADWKKRAAAVEKLFAASKQVDAEVLRGIIAADRAQQMEQLASLFDILIRLTQDVDVHLVKRSLQITQILFRKLSPPRLLEKDENPDDNQRLPHASDEDIISPIDGSGKNAAFYMTKMLAPMIETSANFAEDDEEMESFVYALLGQVFESGCVSVNTIEQALSASSLRHRRSQVREEALKVWIVLLLVAEHEGLLPSNYEPNEDIVQSLGHLLGDTGAHVRVLAFEAAAVLTTVCHCNIYALLEAEIENEYVAQRLDWAALRTRLRQKQVPELRSNGTLRLEPRSRAHRVVPSVEQSLAGVSELRMLVSDGAIKSSGNQSKTSHAAGPPTATLQDNLSKVASVGSLSDRSYFDQKNDVFDGTASCRTTASDDGDMGGKLSALKKKIDHLRRDPRTKRERPSSQERGPPVSAERVMGDVHSSDDNQEKAQFNKSPKRVTANPTKHTPLQSKESKSYQRPRDKNMDANEVLAASSPKTPSHPTQHSPQRQQNLQSNAVYDEDRTLKSKFIGPQNELIEAGVDLTPSVLSPDDRPIRPMATSDTVASAFTNPVNSAEVDTTEFRSVPKRRENTGERVVSLATRKRMETKAKQDAQVTDSNSNNATSPERMDSLIGMEVKADSKKSRKTAGTKVAPNAGSEGDAKARSFGNGKQEPRYLEPHEITPLASPKQAMSKVLEQLRSDNWETIFEALSTTRRLATHHVDLVDTSMVHAIATEILKQVPNLRSSVSKNALLAFESMCGAFARAMDGEVDSFIPVLLRRCADSNAFVCESAAAALDSVVFNCSTARVVAALGAHVNSKAAPIRREVARAMQALLVVQVDDIQTSKELPMILQLVGRCLEDSNNEVRDIAKQSVLHLHYELHVTPERLKRFLPASVQAKVQNLLSGKGVYTASVPAPSPGTKSTSIADEKRGISAGKAKKVKKLSSTKMSPPSSVGGARQGVNIEELDRLSTKLDSNNWKDRFDALSEVTDFICGCAPSLVVNVRMIDLFDLLIKRMDDGNAKVNLLALECMEKIIPAVSNGMEQVLPNFVPVVAKNLSGNARMSGLAQSVIQSLCTHVDGRSLCQQFAIQARSANSRAIPILLDTLTQLTAQSLDDRNNYVLTRQVLPLAFSMLKEAKSGIKEANSRLLRQLRQTLGTSTVVAAATKLGSAQQEKLASILRL